LSIPLYPVNSLEFTARHTEGRITAILSASRNEFFVADFEDGKRITRDEIVPLEALLNSHKKFVSFYF